MYHAAVLGLENTLKEKRHRASENVSSTARIPLPFAVQTHIKSKSNLSFRASGTKAVYVELKAMTENYSVANFATVMSGIFLFVSVHDEQTSSENYANTCARGPPTKNSTYYRIGCRLLRTTNQIFG